jgi:hypothetical protein
VARVNRLLVGALVASLALHVATLVGVPAFDVQPEPEAEPVPLEARLLPPPAPPAPAPPVAAPRPAPRAERRPPPRPVAAPPVPVAATPSSASVSGDQPSSPQSPPSTRGDEPPAPVAAAPSAMPEPLAEAPPPHAPAADYPLRSVRLAYDLLHGESRTRVGYVTHTFRTDGERYEAEAVAEAVGFVSLVFRGRFVQRSRGVIGPDGFVPEEYTLERGRGDPPERATFDWDDGKLDLAWRNERRTVDLPTGAQDPISVLHQIYFIRPLPLSSNLAVASSRKLGHYTYEVLGDEDLQTPMGLVRALHIGRVEQDGSVLEIWLDRDRDLLPARIYSRDRKGTVLDQVLREVAQLEPR